MGRERDFSRRDFSRSRSRQRKTSSRREIKPVIKPEMEQTKKMEPKLKMAMEPKMEPKTEFKPQNNPQFKNTAECFEEQKSNRVGLSFKISSAPPGSRPTPRLDQITQNQSQNLANDNLKKLNLN